MTVSVPRHWRRLGWLAAGYALNELLEVAGFEVTDHLLRALT